MKFKEKSVQVDQLDMEIPMDEASNQADVVPSAQHLAFQPLRTVDGTFGDWWRWKQWMDGSKKVVDY